MKKTSIILFCLMLMAGHSYSFKGFPRYKDPFGTRAFIENKGQFNSVLPAGNVVKFAYQTSGEKVFFTENGLVFRLNKKFPIGEEQKEEMERGKKVKLKPEEVHFIYMNWKGANENIHVEESERTSHYFSYGDRNTLSYGYKKLLYKNVYNNVDIEFTLPEEKEAGIKYSIIVHPGGNVNDIKISYSGDVKSIQKLNEGILIKTPLEDISEHSLKSFYTDREEVASEFSLNNGIISFKFPNGYDHRRELVIDPWTNVLTNMLVNNYAYDVDYDFVGNLYIYGGKDQYKVAKFNTGGVLQWTFMGTVPSINWTSASGEDSPSNFLVNKGNGKCYVGTDWDPSGERVIRLDAAGVYDNFVSSQNPAWAELWDMGYRCVTGEIFGLGGGTQGNVTSCGIINQQNASVTTAAFTGIVSCCQDIVSNAIDDQGFLYVYYTKGAFPPGDPQICNKILKVNQAFNGNLWFMPSTYTTFFENSNKGGYVGAGFPAGFPSSNGFNCLAVNSSYLYFYDGFNLAAYDKNTGVKIGFTTVPLTIKQQGGIDVDDCNNVYIGGNGSILVYSFNGANFNALPSIPLGVNSPNQYVYDIKLCKSNNLLYVCGSGFVGTYNASAPCGVNQVQFNTNCTGANVASGAITLTTNVVNPQINYIWTTGNNNTVSATYSTGATTNTVANLPNGTYTVFVQINAPCGPVYVATVNINCCSPLSIVPSATQVSCTNSVNAVSLSITGGTTSPVITWSPTPGSIGVGSLSATNLPVGVTSINVNYGGCVTTVTVNMQAGPPPLTFTINNLSGSFSITCINPTVNLQAVTNYTFGPVSYSWTSPSFTANTTTVSISQTNTLTVVVTDTNTGCSSTQTVAIGMNTIAPTNTVNPPSQVISCNSGSPVTFTGTTNNPTVNVQHDWYSPLNPPPGGAPIATSNNTVSILSGMIPPGVYTLVTTNLVNGCKTSKTVTVTSLSAWPVFSVNCPTNYSIGCAPLNQTTISIVNPISTQTPPATCSYTFLPPTFTGAVTPSIVLGNNTSTVTQIPGTWTLIVQDNSNFCRTEIPVPIIQNTIAPNVSASALTQTLTCYNPTILATGTSSTPNTNITWLLPITPPNLSTPTVVIGTNTTGPNTSSTSLNYASFTVVATNSVNACQSTSVVVINQNFKPPVSSPTISVGTPTAIFCTVGSAPVVLTTGNSTTTSGGGPTAFVANPCWFGPSPQSPTCGPSSYSCYVPGIYTLTVQDNYNGCISAGTVQILDKTQPPVLTTPNDSIVLDCGSNQASFFAAITGSASGLMYYYYDYPVGAAFSPTNASVPHVSNPILNGTSSPSVNVSLPGTYRYSVTNTLTGCKAYGIIEVGNGGINADFTPDPPNGYAPLAVTFSNNSSTTLGNGNITSIWSFGNGTSQTYTNNAMASTTFTSPGTYTVMLLVQKGSCIDTTYRIVKVDLPSELEVPNIFTPNGDGNNDVFFLKAANLSEIYIIIHDRWGNKVYETTSSTGNIAWDGKNLHGKNCSDGVYFYVIKAKGRDAKDYTAKGNVSIFR